jgi:hypothetical protein
VSNERSRRKFAHCKRQPTRREDQNEVRYAVRGKLEGGLFGTRRFRDEGSFELAVPAATPVPR